MKCRPKAGAGPQSIGFAAAGIHSSISTDGRRSGGSLGSVLTPPFSHAARLRFKRPRQRRSWRNPCRCGTKIVVERTARRILIVSYFFPPMGGIGGFRALKLAKYLPRFGWEVTILTARVPAYYSFDETLEREIPAGTRVLRTASWDPFRTYARLVGGPAPRPGDRRDPDRFFSRVTRLAKSVNTWLFVPDNSVGWLPFAVREGRKHLAAGGVDLVLSKSVPHTAHLVARSLHRATGVPWIADFRDDWVGNPDLVPPTPIHRAIQSRLARSVLRDADGVVAANESLRDRLQAFLGEPHRDRFDTIHTGYDEDDFEGLEPSGPETRFTLVFSGTFHRRLDPRPVFEGIARALSSGRIPRDSFRFVVVGAQQEPLRALARSAGIERETVLSGFLPHREALRRVLAADLLLLLVSRSPGAEMYSTGKLYEYLRAGRPILVAAPDGEASRIVAECRMGVTVPPDDPLAIAEALVAAYERRREGRGDRVGGDRARVAEFAFARQTERFVEFAERILARGRVGVPRGARRERPREPVVPAPRPE